MSRNAPTFVQNPALRKTLNLIGKPRLRKMASSENSGSESEERVSSGEDAAAAEEETGDGGNRETLLDYEKVRLKRIEENRIRMEALGLRRMVSSLMGSAEESKRMGNDGKGKRKMVDEDEEYIAGGEEDEMRSSGEEDGDDEEFSVSQKKNQKKKEKDKVKRNTSTPKKRGPIEKPMMSSSDFVEDDDDLMRAIALSLQDSAGFLEVNSQKVSAPKAATAHKTTSDKRRENLNIQDNSGKRKSKKLVTSRVQMSQDEVLVHFFQFDETGNGSFTLRDLRRLAVSHDFTWSEKELADMIQYFDSDGDGKINFDDFHKIVRRCNMLKGPNNCKLGVVN